MKTIGPLNELIGSVKQSLEDDGLLYAVLYRTKPTDPVRITATVYATAEEADRVAGNMCDTFKAVTCVIGFTRPDWADLDAPADQAGSGLIV